MKLILTSLNSKYIHSNLAIRYLFSNLNVNNIDAEVVEYTINDNHHNLLSDLYNKKADIYAFSCYIWNIKYTLELVSLLKKVLPNSIIILGGPEVSYNSSNLMEEHKQIDFLIKGEGEITLNKLLYSLKNNKSLYDVNGIIYRDNNIIIENNDRQLICNLDDIIFPYKNEDLSKFKDKIIYYESSRGCPFSCSYCLSSTLSGVRFFSCERVKKELLFFINAGVKQVKFVDRTFNCNHNRTKEIIQFLIDNPSKTNFHFEISADLLKEDLLELIKEAPVGLIQFEIGVQSTNLNTIKAINRNTSIPMIEKNIYQLRKYNNIHLHLDLIAGLPHEDFVSFQGSFNDVYKMKPHMLQLGFLKLLKGSPIELDIDKYKFCFFDNPPFEVLSNEFISFEELLILKDIEDLIDKYYNSGYFNSTLEYIINNFFETPFAFYHQFSIYWRKNNLNKIQHAKDELYKILFDFITQLNMKLKINIDIIKELLKYDYLLKYRWHVPKFLNSNKPSKEKIFDFLKIESNIKKYLPQYLNIPAKQIFKKIHMEVFLYNVIDIKNIIKSETILLFSYPKDKKLSNLNDYYEIEKL